MATDFEAIHAMGRCPDWKPGATPNDPPANRVELAAHWDKLGAMVAHIGKVRP